MSISSSSLSVNSSSNQSQPSTSSSRSGSLRREGIVAASQRTFAGSTFGKAAPSPHRANRQQYIEERVALSSINGPVRTSGKTSDSSSRNGPLFLHRNDWISLGEGWYQATVSGSGSINRCGLHSVLESLSGYLFAALYIPRSDQAYQSCLGSHAEYDLEVQAKLMSIKGTGGISSLARQTFLLIFAFKSVEDFCAIRCDMLNKTWSLLRVYNNEEEVIYQAVDESIKQNAFSALLLQIRGCFVSLDVNGQPIFTKTRVRDIASLGGMMGFFVESSKIAVKGWKLKGLQNRGVGLTRGAISAVEEPLPGTNSKATPGMSSVSMPVAGPMPAPLIARRPSSIPQPPIPPQTSQRSMSLSEALLQRRSTPVSDTPSATSQNRSTDDSRLDSRPNQAPIPSTMSRKGVNDEIYSQLTELNDPNLVDWVLQDIVQRDLGITFDDIAALDTAKRLLHEAIVLPLVMPEFFTGIREPWKGVLLFGPPGTGKTMLAKAVCSLQNSTFFNCSASTLVSKYRGETEKIVRVLFQAARLSAPSVIFIDELDSIMGDRDKGQEHEASRRLKTELFAQIDGLASHTKKDSDAANYQKRVVVLAASNCPWDLDPAMRRRLEKRIYIPLPDESARYSLLQILLQDIPISTDVEIDRLVHLTEGYSGSDIQIICRDASMMPMRRLLDLFSAEALVEMKKSGDLLMPKVTMMDFENALGNTRPSVSVDTVLRYQQWEAEFSNK